MQKLETSLSKEPCIAWLFCLTKKKKSTEDLNQFLFQTWKNSEFTSAKNSLECGSLYELSIVPQTGSEGPHPSACLYLWIGCKAFNSIVTVGLSDTFTAVVPGPFYRQHRLHTDKNRLAGTYTMQSHKYTHLQGTLGTTHSQAQSSHFLLAESSLSMKCCCFKRWDSFPSASSSMPRPSSVAEDCR